MMYSFSYLEPVCCSMSSSNCCFLTCIQISQKAGQVVWYSHLLQNFPQFIVIHTVKGFGIVNKADQRLTEFCQENAMVIENTLFQQHKRRVYTWASPDGQHRNQTTFFAAKDGEALYSQQKQDQELTVAQIMNFLLPNSDLT